MTQPFGINSFSAFILYSGVTNRLGPNSLGIARVRNYFKLKYLLNIRKTSNFLSDFSKITSKNFDKIWVTFLSKIIFFICTVASVSMSFTPQELTTNLIEFSEVIDHSAWTNISCPINNVDKSSSVEYVSSVLSELENIRVIEI